MEKILIAMSGGVDSAVAAMLLKRQNFDCAGGTMELGSGTPDKARAASEALGLPFFVFDCVDAFHEHVIRPFIEAYRSGRTPNPCVGCNSSMKFGVFMRHALDMGFDKIATGHYARAERAGERILLKKGLDPIKDQSYYLHALTQEQLSRTVFPLGGLTKAEVRELALEAGLAAAKDSQDICFIPDGDYASFIGGGFPKGRFVDTEGNDLGEHRGIIHYTVGQRRGLGLAAPEPLYVKEIQPESNTVVVGTEETLYTRTLTVKNCNLIALNRIDTPLRAAVKIRYRHIEQPATVTRLDGDALRVDFDEPQRAVTPGQAAVLYDGDVVLGGGTIEG
jgi:tRNA-specific 2-thiouridylase